MLAGPKVSTAWERKAQIYLPYLLLFTPLDVICQKILKMQFLCSHLQFLMMLKLYVKNIKRFGSSKRSKGLLKSSEIICIFIFKGGHVATSSKTQSKYFSCQYRCQLSLKLQATTSEPSGTCWDLQEV